LWAEKSTEQRHAHVTRCLDGSRTKLSRQAHFFSSHVDQLREINFVRDGYTSSPDKLEKPSARATALYQAKKDSFKPAKLQNSKFSLETEIQSYFIIQFFK
jgi:hypothetical protein